MLMNEINTTNLRHEAPCHSEGLGSLLAVLAAHQVGEHGVGGALAAAQPALVVGLHLGVALGQELLDVLQPHHRLLRGLDPLLQPHGNLHL